MLKCGPKHLPVSIKKSHEVPSKVSQLYLFKLNTSWNHEDFALAIVNYLETNDRFSLSGHSKGNKNIP